MSKKKGIIVSGYFNPLHKGHIEYFNNAKELADELFVIVNSDHQRVLKGSKEFQKEAAEALADKVEIDKKHINALAKIYHKQSFAMFQQQKEEIEDLYESIVK